MKLRKIGEYKDRRSSADLFPRGRSVSVIGWRPVSLRRDWTRRSTASAAMSLGRARGDGSKRCCWAAMVETQPHAGLAGWRARRALRPGGCTHARRQDRCRRLGRATRKGISAHFIRQPLVLRAAGGRRDRHAAQSRGEPRWCWRCIGAKAGCCRSSTRHGRSRALRRGYMEAHIEQGAELEERPASVSASSYRNCRQPPASAHPVRGCAEPRRHHTRNVRSARDAGVALVNLAHMRSTSRFPRCGGPAHRVDRRTHHAGSWRWRAYSARPCRDGGVPVPRHRSRNAGEAGWRA